ncbi:MAG TPA: helix-turn-helix transcriptional regulator [Thermodesulfovibrionales bacterium]|nr:helix-turn-helix transcriptional regulator [Thermodesulfovibrionales bacterium]
MTRNLITIEDYEQYFVALELKPSATFPEVKDKYNYLKSLYSADSMELSALNLDLTPDQIRLVLERLDEAYKQLTTYFEHKNDDSHRKELPWMSRTGEIRAYAEDIGKFTGPVLKDIRVKFDIELKDVADITRIGKRQLESIEAEHFSSFEADIYLHGYISAYARCLSLDPQKVSADYMERYRAWKAANTRES